MNENKRKYYENADVARFLAAFLVVAIHTRFLERISAGGYFVLMTICGAAVPLFFACSGFFLFSRFTWQDGKIEKSQSNLRGMLQYEKRLLITYLFWSAIYFVLDAVAALRKGTAIGAFALQFVRDFFLNGSHNHLWYVVCLFYAVPLLYLFLRHVRMKHFLWLLPALYVAGQLVEGYFWAELPLMETVLQIKNALGYVFQVPFRAITFAGAGILLSQQTVQVGKRASALFAVLFYLAGAAEVYIVSARYCETVNIRYSMFSLLMVFFLMSALVQSAGQRTKLGKCAVFLRKTSSFIYFVHPAVMFSLQVVVPAVAGSAYLYFPVTCLLSFAAAAIVVRLSEKIKLLKYTF